jgi:hypothetical protein
MRALPEPGGQYWLTSVAEIPDNLLVGFVPLFITPSLVALGGGPFKVLDSPPSLEWILLEVMGGRAFITSDDIVAAPYIWQPEDVVHSFNLDCLDRPHPALCARGLCVREQSQEGWSQG